MSQVWILIPSETCGRLAEAGAARTETALNPTAVGISGGTLHPCQVDEILLLAFGGRLTSPSSQIAGLRSSSLDDLILALHHTGRIAWRAAGVVNRRVLAHA